MIATAHSLSLALVQVVYASEFDRWVELISGIAQIIIALALIVAALAFAGIALAVRALVNKLGGVASRVQEDVQPVLRHTRDVAENVNYISTAVRDDVDQFKGVLQRTQGRLERASQAAETRIEEFNALLEVVQEEAERIFIDTASAIRGVQAGASTLQRVRTPAWEEVSVREEIHVERDIRVEQDPVEPVRRPRPE